MQQQPTPISDEQIIDLSFAYDATSPAQRKNTADYLRDGAYYTNGYVRLRMRGLTHEEARELFLTTAGRIFLRDGQPHRVKGASAFPLLDRYASTGDVSAHVTAYRDTGYNMFRVWPYVPSPPWDPAWNPPPNDVIIAFVRHLRDEGFTVEITLLTDDDPARIPWARRLVEDFAAVRPENLLLEIGNEPLTHKNIRVEDLKDVCDRSG